MSRVIVLATRNPDKARELQWLFADLPVSKVIAADHLGDDVPDVDETGTTLEENALLKARALAEFSGELCIADDTGLEVDALDGRPGVYAARYAGPDATYADNCDKLVAELQGVPEAERTARFRTVMAMVDPRGEEGVLERTVEGVLEGRILGTPRGDDGFGYDPLFFVPDLGRTLAEVPLEEKNRISHRARASRAMVELLRGYLEAVPE